MNAARHRRKLLQQKIRKEHEEKLLDRLLEEERQRTLCPHNILQEQCIACEEIYRKNFDRFLQSPMMMEARLRRQLGLHELPIRAYVMLKCPPGCMPRLVRTQVSVDHATSDIAAMKRNGFWAVDCGYLTWFDGDQIAEVSLDTIRED